MHCFKNSPFWDIRESNKGLNNHWHLPPEPPGRNLSINAEKWWGAPSWPLLCPLVTQACWWWFYENTAGEAHSPEGGRATLHTWPNVRAPVTLPQPHTATGTCRVLHSLELCLKFKNSIWSTCLSSISTNARHWILGCFGIFSTGCGSRENVDVRFQTFKSKN